MQLTNNTILITGGTSGLGYEFARQLMAKGNTVIITGRDQAKLDEAKKSLPGVHTFQSDVSDPRAIVSLHHQVLQQFPAVNILINNAGEMRKIDLHDTSYDLKNITREISTNLSGPIRMVQQYLPHLQTVKNAAILNVTSGVALVPFPLSPVYGATKAGLRSYTKSLRVQVKKDGIKVFELAAPAARTPLSDAFASHVGDGALMDPAKLIAQTIKAMQSDHYEIYPGIAKVMLFMSRFFPSLIFGQMAKIAEKALG